MCVCVRVCMCVMLFYRRTHKTIPSLMLELSLSLMCWYIVISFLCGQIQFRKTPIGNDVCIDTLVARTTGFSGAEVWMPVLIRN